MPFRLSPPFGGWSCNIKIFTSTYVEQISRRQRVRESRCEHVRRSNEFVWACACVRATSLSLRVKGAAFWCVNCARGGARCAASLPPESDTLNSAVSPQTTISGVKGNREGTYRLITSFKLRCRSVTLPGVTGGHQEEGGWTYFSQKFCDKSEQLAASGGLVGGAAWPTCGPRC